VADDEIEVLRAYAHRSAALGNRHVSNLSNRYAVSDYCQMADEIAQLAGGGRLLDWGCGYGHMSWLLRRRGFDVAGLTVPDENNLSDSWSLLVREQGLKVVVAGDEVALPFEDASFDVVLSCGVLEHVPDEAGSLREIARVLKPGGFFFVYQLPNRLSAVEWLSERLIGVAHERRYGRREVGALLAGAGFSIVSQRYGSMIPKNLDRLPFARRLFDRNHRFVAALDAALLRFPVVKLFSGTWEIVAQRAGIRSFEAGKRRASTRDLVAVEAASDGTRGD